MNSYSLLFKQYFKNKFLCVFTILFNVAVFFRLIYSCTRIIGEPLSYLQSSLEMSVFSFVFFMFVAYGIVKNHKKRLCLLLSQLIFGFVYYCSGIYRCISYYQYRGIFLFEYERYTVFYTHRFEYFAQYFMGQCSGNFNRRSIVFFKKQNSVVCFNGFDCICFNSCFFTDIRKYLCRYRSKYFFVL